MSGSNLETYFCAPSCEWPCQLLPTQESRAAASAFLRWGRSNGWSCQLPTPAERFGAQGCGMRKMPLGCDWLACGVLAASVARTIATGCSHRCFGEFNVASCDVNIAVSDPTSDRKVHQMPALPKQPHFLVEPIVSPCLTPYSFHSVAPEVSSFKTHQQTTTFRHRTLIHFLRLEI